MIVYLKNRYTKKVITQEEFVELDGELQAEYDIIPFDSKEYEEILIEKNEQGWDTIRFL